MAAVESSQMANIMVNKILKLKINQNLVFLISVASLHDNCVSFILEP